MHLHTNLVSKPATDLVAGELFILPRGNGLAIALRQLDERRTLFGFLQDGERSQAYTWLAASIDGPCLSYGTEWVLDLHYGPETHSSNRQRYDLGSVIFLDGSSIGLVFAPSSKTTFDTYEIDLRTGDQMRLGEHAAPVTSWSIWASQRDRQDPRGLPLVVCPAPAAE